MSKRYKYIPGHELSDNSGMVDVDLLKGYKKLENFAYKFEFETKKSDKVKAPSIHYIPDEMSPTKHPCTGQVYTSKKKFRNETKARGCYEIGNDYSLKQRKFIEPDPRQRREHIEKAIYELKNKS